MRWLIRSEAKAIYQLLCEKAVVIPARKGFIPAILPIIALSSIYTYTTISMKRHETPTPIIKQAEIRAEPEPQPIFNGAAPAQTMTAHNAQHEKESPEGLSVKKEAISFSPRPFARPKAIIPDITRGSSMKKELSLTFDGGSDATDAESILNILREKNIKTTIFLTGGFIKRYPELVKQMGEDGHEIGNHTMMHPHLTTYERNFKQQTLPGVDREFVVRELKETNRIFRELTGRDMIPYWRAPYGEQNAEIREWAYEAGFTHVGWTTDHKKRESLDTLDWVSNEESEFYYSADEIKERILNFDKEGNGVSGGIVLMHLGTDRKESHAYTKLPEIIDTLADRGYRIVKVTELLKNSR